MELKHEYGDQPVEAEYIEKMRAIARGIDEIFNGKARGGDRKVGFLMLVFPFGDDPTGRVNYISNGASREDVIVLMKEQIKRFEGQPEMSGNA